MSGMSINDDEKLRSLKESWTSMESQMAGTEDKDGHVTDQGNDVTKTGDEQNTEANSSGDQHVQYSKSVRNGPSFDVKEGMGGMMTADDMEDDPVDDDLNVDTDVGGEMGGEIGDDLGDDLGDEMGDASPWDTIARAFGDLQAAFDQLKGDQGDLGGDDLGGDDLGDDLGGEDDLDEVINRYDVTESKQRNANARMARIREARARRRS